MNSSLNKFTMRKYDINKFKGNTHYTVNVTDSYGRQKGNFFRELNDCYNFIYEVWEQEKPLTDKEIEQKLLANAIAECIKIDKNNGLTPNLD